jgi:hypothetical protein
MAKKRMAKANHEPKQKAIAYQLILQHSDDGAPLYERLYAIIDTHHEDVSHANVRSRSPGRNRGSRTSTGDSRSGNARRRRIWTASSRRSTS